MHDSSNSLWKETTSADVGGMDGNMSEISSQVGFNHSPPLPASSVDSASVTSIFKQVEIVEIYLYL